MKKLLFLGCFFYLIILLIDASYILNCLSVLLFIVLLLYFMKNRKDFFVMSLFFSYGYFSTALVCLIAEPGSYFTEIQEFSFLTGATARNTLLCFFTLWGAAISFEWMYKSNLRFSKFSYRTDKFEMFATTSIYCLSILSLYYIYLTYGSPNDY